MKSGGYFKRHHIVLIDRNSKFENQIKGKSDTFKDVVIDTTDFKDLALGDYCEVRIDSAKGKTLFATPVAKTNIQGFFQKSLGKPFIE
jgi:hypothetical protein